MKKNNNKYGFYALSDQFQGAKCSKLQFSMRF